MSTDHWTHATNPYAGPESAPFAPARTPGIETRQVLLVVGAGCLVAAMAAGTALIWGVLRPSGQAALMLVITAALLVGAVRLRRLPATADALAAVGVAALLIDCVAGRSLGLAGVRSLPLHVYAGLVSTAVAIVLVSMARLVPRLWAPPVGAAVAVLAAVVSWMQPTTPLRIAWLGPISIATVAALDLLLRRVGPTALAGRIVAVTLGAVIVAVATATAIVDTVLGGPSGWAGVVTAGALWLLPELSPVRSLAFEWTTAMTAGGLLSVLLFAAEHDATADRLTVLTVGLTAVAVAAALPHLRSRGQRVQLAVGMACAPSAFGFYALMDRMPRQFVVANLVLAGIAVAVSVGWPRARAEQLGVRAGAAVSAVVVSTIGVDGWLSLHHVTAPEPYVVVPALGAVLIGAAVMAASRSTSSWVLAPGIALGLLPTLHLALAGDAPRQAAIVFAGALLIVIGAQLRLAAPLVTGGVAISLVVLRVGGPEVARMPHWLSLGIVGAVLLALGATWEARLVGLRRASHAMRPRIAALR